MHVKCDPVTGKILKIYRQLIWQPMLLWCSWKISYSFKTCDAATLRIRQSIRKRLITKREHKELEWSKFKKISKLNGKNYHSLVDRRLRPGFVLVIAFVQCISKYGQTYLRTTALNNSSLKVLYLKLQSLQRNEDEFQNRNWPTF